MKRRVLTAELGGPVDNIVRGPGVYELVQRATGRPPTYIALRRGYSVQEATARNVIAFAEQLGYDVVITGPRAVACVTGDEGTRVPSRLRDHEDEGVVVATPEPVEPGPALW